MSDTPSPDPEGVIEDLEDAPTEEDALEVETEAVEQTDNGLQEGDPVDQPENPVDDESSDDSE